MRSQSSFILIPNPYKDNKVTKISDQLGGYINNYIQTSFSNVIPVNTDCYYKFKFETGYSIKTDTYRVEFLVTEVTNNIYLDIVVEGKTVAKNIQCLEVVQDKILNSGIRDKYIDIVSYDAVSEYYCNKLYPKLNELERNLRKLLFNIYIMEFGKYYFSRTIPESSQLEIKENIGRNTRNKVLSEIKSIYKLKSNNEAKEINYLQSFFYSLEFANIENILFLESNNEYSKKELEKFLNSNKDLSKLSDSELRNAFENLQPKNDWERFFHNKIGIDNIKAIIDSIRKYRNIIAHCKTINKKEYSECCNLMKKFNKAVLNAIQITEDKDFELKNSKTLRGYFDDLYKMALSFKELPIMRLMPAINSFAQTLDLVRLNNRVNEISPILQSGWFKNLQSVVDDINKKNNF